MVGHAANLQDRDGAKLVRGRLKPEFCRLRLIWADRSYAGQLLQWVKGLRQWRKVQLEIVPQADTAKGFVVQPHRWIVERTFGWLSRYRRLSTDSEFLTSTSEAMIQVAMINLMVRRLARKRAF